MKRILLLTSFFFCMSHLLVAQQLSPENVPEPVKAGFNLKYSGVKKVKWELDYENYVVQFKMKKTEMIVRFDKDGRWLETEYPIKPSAISAAVKEYMNANFFGFSIDQVQKVETSDKGILYELEINKAEASYEVSVSEGGLLLERADTTPTEKAKY